jgi:hypothetical protein
VYDVITDDIDVKKLTVNRTDGNLSRKRFGKGRIENMEYLFLRKSHVRLLSSKVGPTWNEGAAYVNWSRALAVLQSLLH